MADLTAEQIVEKQIRRAVNATEDFKRGVRSTKKNPMERAIKAIPKMRANILRAIDEGIVAEGLASVPMSEWQESTAGKGGDRYATGVEKSKPKLLEFQRQIKPHRDALKEQIDNMPDETFEQRMARMVANAQGMRQFRFKKRGR